MMNRFFASRKKKEPKQDNESLNDADRSLLNQLVPTYSSQNNTDNKNVEKIDYIDDVATVANYININDSNNNRTKSIGTISTIGSSNKSTNNFLSVDFCYAIQHKPNNLQLPNMTNERINDKHRRPSIFDYMNEQDIDSETENQLLKSTKTPCSTVSNSSIDFVETSTTTLNTTNEKSFIKSLDTNNNDNRNGINKGPKNISYSISSDNFVRVTDGSLTTSTSQIPLLQISFASDDQDGKYDLFMLL
jgi:hypothetical protein